MQEDSSGARTRRRVPRRYGRDAIAALAFAGALLLASGPFRRHDDARTRAPTQVDAPLAWTVNRAQAMHRLGTSSMDAREAAPGHQFVVLDVSVRNRDAQPQVLSEGKLIAMDAANLQTFDRPVTVFSDDYLSLQVLEPAQRLHGKIAYEVPEDLHGVLFWNPGNGSERILLNLTTPATPQRTLANVDDDTGAGTNVEPSSIAAHMQGRAAVSGPPARDATPKPVVVAAAPPSSPAAKATTEVASVARAPRHVATDPPVTRTAPREVATREGATRVLPPSTTIVTPPPARVVLPVSAMPARTPAAQPQVDGEQARRLACEGMVARDDPAEKERSLGFFAQSCRDYALPAHWQPQRVARRSLLKRASDLLARVVVAPRVVRISDCSSGSASHADRLVCGDPDLSAMDHRLAQSVARASEHVDDPAALQRAQDEWRGRVRNACDTTGCLAQVYGRRIAQLEAMGSMRP